MDRSEKNAAIDRDAQRSLRYGSPLMVLLFLGGGAPHLGEPLDAHVAATFGAPLLFAIQAGVAWTRLEWLRPPWLWLVIPWAIAQPVLLMHVAETPHLALAFLAMSTLTAAGLLIPFPALAVALPVGVAEQVYAASRIGPSAWNGALLVPLSSLLIGVVLHSARRRAILALERQRILERSLHAQQERLDRREREQLEAMVRHRSEALADSRRSLAARARLASLGTLAAGIAHQVKNPVGATLAAAELALLHGDEAEADAKRLDALRDIRREAQRAARLLKSMLRFARSEETERWKVDLGSVLRTALRATEPYAREVGATLRVRVDDAVAGHAVAMNPIEIEEALTNLLRNAIEASGAGGLVRISARIEGERVEARVEDDGPGVEPTLRERIFEPFFTTRAQAGGSGLGLSVAAGVAAEHGGRLWLEDAEDGASGACFVLQLPIEPRGGEPTVAPPTGGDAQSAHAPRPGAGGVAG